MAFFNAYSERFSVDFEEIVPRPDTEPAWASRAVYAGLVRKLHGLVGPEIREMVESLWCPYRLRVGALNDADHRQLLQHFQAMHSDCRSRYSSFHAYKSINGMAAQLAMLLFVDNCLKQGIGRLSKSENEQTLNQLADFIQKCHRDLGLHLNRDNAFFYARYFLTQTLFDKLFVGDEEIVQHDTNGAVSWTANYASYTAYLELSNQKLVNAHDAERALSYAITTGWREGIDVDTWNELNRDYYSRSEDNFFSNDYDGHLEKMLPQFPIGKARAAADVVAAWSGERMLNLVEIGAGSGSFAIDLFFALKHQNKSTSLFGYRGVEPSGAMMAVFTQHFQTRTSTTAPKHWDIVELGLEGFLEQFETLLPKDQENVLVFSYSAHHCFRDTLQRMITHPRIQALVSALYILDGTREHGWTKWTYMPLDCRSPEDFENVALTGPWTSETLWHEPHQPLPHHAVSTAWSALRKLTPPGAHLFRGIKPGFLIDLDGTLYCGCEAVPGGMAFLHELRKRNLPFFLLTNRSERTPAQIVAHLTQLGFANMEPDRILTSATVTARQLKPGSAFWLGGNGLGEALIAAGFTQDSEQPEYVIVGLDREVTYAKLQKAVDLIVKGARFIATNADKRINTESGFAPGCGALVAAITAATDKDALVMGKPETAMFEAAIQQMDMPAHQLFVIGDSLSTDIAGGQNAGLKTILTLTGVNSLDDLQHSSLQPSLTVENLGDILKWLD